MVSRVILLGASAGGVSALSQLVKGLPADLPAAVFVVLHVAPYGKSAMPAILSRAGRLPAVHPKDEALIEEGHIYVAPPDYHLILENGHIRLSRGASENSQRPAVDVLFRTGARSYGRRAVAVVLTGNLDDGTAGLAVVKRHGGVSIVQDPDDADYPGMPISAIENVDVDHVIPLAGIAALLVKLVNQPVEDPDPPAGGPEDTDMKEEIELGNDPEEQGVPSDLTCPACGGSLRESRIEDVVHFRCRTGHAYSPATLLAKQTEVIEAALWAALRALEENAALSRRMERRMRVTNQLGSAGEVRYNQRAQEAEGHADVLRKLLMADEEDSRIDSSASRTGPQRA